MLRLRMLSIPVALLLTASAASAQRWAGGSRGTGGHGSPPAVRPATGGSQSATASPNGTPPRWGGSPPERSHDGQRGRIGLYGQPSAYIPIAMAAPDPVPAYVDSCPPPPEASVEMPVITTRHEERQLTTIEVYRLQPRFQKP